MRPLDTRAPCTRLNPPEGETARTLSGVAEFENKSTSQKQGLEVWDGLYSVSSESIR